MPKSSARPASDSEPSTDAAAPFREAAQELCRLGLAVIPVGGLEGKTPLIKWRSWARAPGKELIAKAASRFPTANVGIICHLSGITVVDIDDRDLLSQMIDRFGDTPLKVRTPSNGVHLWFRHDGERCANLRKSENLAIDIKGAGGFILVPPSLRPSGPYSGARYTFLEGSWNDLSRLPKLRRGSIIRRSTTLRTVKEGVRNDMLFRLLLRHAPHCDTEADLLDVGQTINDDHMRPPLSDPEVTRVARSVWRYECTEMNWAGEEARVVIRKSQLRDLSANPDALALWLHLKICHGARTEPFAVSSKAMATAEVIPGWRDPRRYARTSRWLVDRGLLKILQPGGRGPSDPRLFAFCAAPYDGVQDVHPI